MGRPRVDLAAGAAAERSWAEEGRALRRDDAAPRRVAAPATWREARPECGAAAPADLATRALRVLSANLLGGRAHPDAFRALIADAAVDVVCVQELDDRLAERLGAALPEGRLIPCPRRRGLGVLSRRPLSVRPLALGGRDGLVATLDPADWPMLSAPVEIVNVHILAPHTWPYFPRRHRRPEQMRRLLSYLDSHPVPARAVVGDFNATPWWPAYWAIAARYVDALAALPGPAPRTWPNLSRLGLPGLLRIDHCFTSGLRAQRAARIPIPGSDHYAICVDLVASDPAPRGAAVCERGGGDGARSPRS